MKVYLIEKDKIGYYTKDLSELEDLLDSIQEESFTVTNKEMSEEEFNNLPEFDGF